MYWLAISINTPIMWPSLLTDIQDSICIGMHGFYNWIESEEVEPFLWHDYNNIQLIPHKDGTSGIKNSVKKTITVESGWGLQHFWNAEVRFYFLQEVIDNSGVYTHSLNQMMPVFF